MTFFPVDVILGAERSIGFDDTRPGKHVISGECLGARGVRVHDTTEGSTLMPFGSQTTLRGATAIVTVSGEVDMSTATAVAAEIEDAKRSAATALIVDLTGVSFLSSSGVTVLLKAHHGLESGTFGIVAGNRSSRMPLELSGLDRVFPLYADLDEALDVIGAD